VLGSATPQLESYHNAGIGKYQLLTLKERIDKKSLPEIDIIDLKKEKRKFISQQLESKIEETLKMNEQIILFLNRRGFAPNLLCPYCGYVTKCPYCNLPMVYHKSEGKNAATLWNAPFQAKKTMTSHKDCTRPPKWLPGSYG